ncbi:HET-domain-containing protein, partial [Hyaloscypha bicolor E]
MFTFSRPGKTQRATDNEALTIDDCTNNPSDASGFVYSPLHNPTKEIRLLVLKSKYQSERGSYRYNIECSLRLVPLYLLSITNYEALSYTWGSPEDGVREIRLGGKPFDVRINLWWALDHLRYPDRPRILWIDALCIDQSNEIERNHQVRQMGLVYREASKVIVWLGLPAANSNAAFEFIVDGNTASLDIQAGACEISNPVHTTNLNAFFALCERGYWSRLWVVQEIVLAKELMVSCGPNVATWTAFSRALQGYEHYDRIKSSLPYLFDRQRSDRYYECRLINLLEACQASECADPRDKVYGLLGLANDCGEDELVVDYSKTVYEVYRDVIAF